MITGLLVEGSIVIVEPRVNSAYDAGVGVWDGAGVGVWDGAGVGAGDGGWDGAGPTTGCAPPGGDGTSGCIGAVGAGVGAGVGRAVGVGDGAGVGVWVGAATEVIFAQLASTLSPV